MKGEAEQDSPAEQSDELLAENKQTVDKKRTIMSETSNLGIYRSRPTRSGLYRCISIQRDRISWRFRDRGGYRGTRRSRLRRAEHEVV